MLKRKSSRGLTLIELLVTIAIVAILAAIAIPSYNSFSQRFALTGAAEGVYSHLEYARSESIANGTDIFVAFKGTGATGWCMGISDTAACNCDNAVSLAACTINGAQARYLNGADYPDITLNTDFTDHDTGFDSPRSVSKESGNVTLSLPGYGNAEIRVNPLGRLRLCSDTLDIYAGCP